MLCVSVWPSAITRMCNYNLAQVKFNQSPQAQRNLLSQEKGGGGEGEREEEIKGGKGEGERMRKREEGFPTEGTRELLKEFVKLIRIFKFEL